MAKLIEIKGLTVSYNGKKVLDDVSLDIDEGEMIGIIGRSGSGKTVLLNVIRGMDEDIPARGQVIFHLSTCKKCGRMEMPSKAGSACVKCGGTLEPFSCDMLDDPDDRVKRRITRRIAMMMQRTFGIYGDDSVIENVLKALDDIGFDGDRISKAADLIDKVKLSHRMLHIARDLSGGEKQRVVLVRQMAKEPMILLADEPTGTLDPKTAKVVHQNIKALSTETGISILITSHFSDVIRDLASRAILVEDGKVIADGAPDTVINEFIGKCGLVERKEVEAGEPVIRIEGLFKKYFSVDRGVINAVNGVTLDIKESEIFGIVGTSGAGKTSLTNILTGNLEPTSGIVEMRVGDDWINMCEPGYYARGRAKPYIGLLYQEYDLYPHRSVIENMTDSIGLEFPAELAEKKAIHTLKSVGFTEQRSADIMERSPGELSEGEKHRVALAQVLIKEPHIIVLDEPTGTMDPITKNSVANSILSVRQESGETFVIVSHDMDFVEMVCDRVAFMRGGKVVAIGPPKEILTSIRDVPA